jgi:hypothetical protein
VLLSEDAEGRRGLLDSLNARGIHAHAVDVEAGVRIEMRPDPLLAGWLAG